MLSYARRLKEIADSNKPAFASITGTEWWLADVPAKGEGAKSSSPANPVLAADSVLNASPAPIRDEKRVAAALEADSGDTLRIEDFLRKDQAPVEAASTQEPGLTWNPRTSSFVATV